MRSKDKTLFWNLQIFFKKKEIKEKEAKRK